jgi:hypothetical protein
VEEIIQYRHPEAGSIVYLIRIDDKRHVVVIELSVTQGRFQDKRVVKVLLNYHLIPYILTVIRAYGMHLARLLQSLPQERELHRYLLIKDDKYTFEYA